MLIWSLCKCFCSAQQLAMLPVMSHVYSKADDGKEKFHSCTVFCASGEFYFKQKSPCALITSSTLAHVQY